MLIQKCRIKYENIDYRLPPSYEFNITSTKCKIYTFGDFKIIFKGNKTNIVEFSLKNIKIYFNHSQDENCETITEESSMTLEMNRFDDSLPLNQSKGHNPSFDPLMSNMIEEDYDPHHEEGDNILRVFMIVMPLLGIIALVYICLITTAEKKNRRFIDLNEISYNGL
ncbi:hypothetical protein RF11_03049 [Thelohanellus kitauei]|uniref:Uncharacterized protein n=1 Tax=Thelohanellus kitauei TaxID=669202 RepID=A0A0C2ITT3_THEKT|nr:hypothetical protein RF11_03049 [Thelohanellus kitauei]